jgi:hypothetical protein
MLRPIDTRPELLNTYANPQKIVFTVITAAPATIYVATNINVLRSQAGGVQQGTPITAASQVALDVVGDVWWLGSAAGIQVDVFEGGAL